jgi:histidinol-phosphatase (PHP family)
MKVDYHVHLEEGPYSIRWWNRTAQALLSFREPSADFHTMEWMHRLSEWMSERVRKGPFSPEWLDLYRQRAKQLGLREVGIVDHLYRFREYKSYYEQYVRVDDSELGRLQRVWLDQVCMASLEEFHSFIRQQQAVWEQDGIRLKLGIEADYFAGGEAQLKGILQQYEWDYVIGSVHFVDGWGFDNPETEQRFAETNLLALYRREFELVEGAIRSRLFDFLAHLDNLKVFGYRPDETELLSDYERIAQTLREHDTATEINTGLQYRYPVKEACPSPTFLKILQQHDVPITTSSDAHFPDHLAMHLEEARERLKEAGYTKIVTFDRRKRLEVPLE